MKKKFSFENLEAEEREFSISAKESIFFSMYDLLRNCAHPIWINTIYELDSLLINETYYIALNIISRKGKQEFFREELVLCSKIGLLHFLSKEVDTVSEYSRPFLISPLFSTQPEYVVSINEEACIRYYK